MGRDDLETMQEILDEMKEIYLRDDREWALMYSTGKDSTLCLLLTWQMLLSLPPEKRIKKVHVVTSDTLVEAPSMVDFVRLNLQSIQDQAVSQGIPIVTHLVTPQMKQRFWFRVIGKGVTPPNERSRYRDCTDKMKILPLDQKVKEIIAAQTSNVFDEHDIVMILGTRLSESSNRKRSIEKFAIDDTKFSRHAKHDRILVYLPIKYVGLEELWTYLLKIRKFPWGRRATELYAMYKDSAGECPMTSVEGSQGNSCGGGRLGCWTCCFVTGLKDKMLEHLIASGEENMQLLYDYKKMLKQMRNDPRYREVLRRKEYRRIDEDRVAPPSFFHEFQRGEWSYEPGPFTIEARKILLQKLLYIQAQSGYSLIDSEEVEAIIEAWKSDGFQVSLEDLEPKDWQYDGAMVFLPNGDFNIKESTCSTPFFFVWKAFRTNRDEIHRQIKQKVKETGKSFFYFMTCLDIKATDTQEEPVNLVMFIVRNPDIESKEEAIQIVNEWLKGIEIFDLQEFVRQAAFHRLKEPNHDRNQVADLVTMYLLSQVMFEQKKSLPEKVKSAEESKAASFIHSSLLSTWKDWINDQLHDLDVLVKRIDQLDTQDEIHGFLEVNITLEVSKGENGRRIQEWYKPSLFSKEKVLHDIRAAYGHLKKPVRGKNSHVMMRVAEQEQLTFCF